MQLDEVLKRNAQDNTAEADAAGPSQAMSQQMIQRWLVIFAREHLPDICEKVRRPEASNFVPSFA
ncbi:MAG: hypothetical protein SGPRY_007468 [Prymnesium sp.]